jgi:hypothetical protein
VGLSVWGDEVEKQGLVLSGVMFNYKISPASRTIFLAVLQAQIFLIKKISMVLNFHLSSFSGESLWLYCGRVRMDRRLEREGKNLPANCVGFAVQATSPHLDNSMVPETSSRLDNSMVPETSSRLDS